MIDEVLDLSRIDAGGAAPAEEVVDLGLMIANTVRMLEPRALQKQIEVRTEIPPALPRVRADPRMLQQILMNLLSNAVKFTPEGGRVGVRAEHGPRRGIAVVIDDTGVGIPADDLDKVLEPFQRGSNALREGIPGTGLGLSITRHLAELHGGRIAIESRLGRGTTVRVSFPRNRIVTPSGA